jgi:hypothetical protein
MVHCGLYNIPTLVYTHLLARSQIFFEVPVLICLYIYSAVLNKNVKDWSVKHWFFNIFGNKQNIFLK